MEEIKSLQYIPLTSEEVKVQSALYDPSVQQEWVRFGPKGYTFLKEYEKYAGDIYKLPLKKDDIFVTCYQRSGTTWTQELVWLIANDLNYDIAKTVPLARRYPFLEQVCFFNEDARKVIVERAGNNERVREIMAYLGTPASKMVAGMPSPRFVKTHLPLALLPPNLLDTAKVVYVARDPRDVAVSSYHHARLFKPLQFKGTFKELWTAFRKDLFTLTPYFEHVKEAWALRNHPNMLFLFYEDHCKDLKTSIRRVSNFLGKKLTAEQVEGLCDYLSFENFKNNKAVNYEDVRQLGFLDANETFIRKGAPGSWREYFDEEMERDAKEWIEENLKDTDLRFPGMEL